MRLRYPEFFRVSIFLNIIKNRISENATILNEKKNDKIGSMLNKNTENFRVQTYLYVNSTPDNIRKSPKIQ